MVSWKVLRKRAALNGLSLLDFRKSSLCRSIEKCEESTATKSKTNKQKTIEIDYFQARLQAMCLEWSESDNQNHMSMEIFPRFWQIMHTTIWVCFTVFICVSVPNLIFKSFRIDVCSISFLFSSPCSFSFRECIETI